MSSTHHVILTKRSSRLRIHKSQVSFPGGKQDFDDKDETDCALRETEEELGISRSKLTKEKWTLSNFKLRILLFTIFRKIQVAPIIFKLDPDVADSLGPENTKIIEVPGIVKVNPAEVEYAFHSKLANFSCPGLEKFWLYNYNTTMIEMKPDKERLRIWGLRN